MSDVKKKLYTVKEVSKILGVSITCVYSLIDGGLLPALNIRGLKIRDESIDHFLKQYEGYDINDPEDIKKIVQ